MANRQRSSQLDLFQSVGPHGHENPLYIGEYIRGCRCFVCVATFKEYRKQYHSKRLLNDSVYRQKKQAGTQRQLAKAKEFAASGATHHIRPTVSVGESGYAAGCRCEGCRGGHSAYQTKRAKSAKSRRVRAEWRAKQPESTLESQRAYDVKRLRAQTEWLHSVKLSAGCADCGYMAHAAALDFDHVHGEKSFGIGAKRASVSKSRLLAEVAKTVVRCARCHRLKTALAERGNGGYRRTPPTRPSGLFDAPYLVKRRAKDRGRKLKRAAINREKLDRIKLTHGCADCGYREEAVGLDFDHVHGTKFRNPSGMVLYSTARLTAEIAKCEIVCANCHRIRTYERRKATI